MPALSAVLLILSFQLGLLFFNISLTRPHQHCSVLLVLIRNIGHRTLPKNLDRYLSGVQHKDQGKDSEVILMVKITITHPLEGPFECEFPAICTRCGVMMTA